MICYRVKPDSPSFIRLSVSYCYCDRLTSHWLLDLIEMRRSYEATLTGPWAERWARAYRSGRKEKKLPI